MFNLQGSEIIVILLLALVVLGPEKLPDAIRKFSRTYAELKKMGNGFQSELKSALDEPMREMRETANAVRDAADPTKVDAQADAERRLAAETSDDDSWIDAPHLQSPDEHANGVDSTNGTGDTSETSASNGTHPSQAETQRIDPSELPMGTNDPGSSRIALPGDSPGWGSPIGPATDAPAPDAADTDTA
ncbi:MAG: twin-arginine translocase TatA/TatE family subunit [Actinomycetota bacterium]